MSLECRLQACLEGHTHLPSLQYQQGTKCLYHLHQPEVHQSHPREKRIYIMTIIWVWILLIFFSCSKDRRNRRIKAKYLNIKMILVKNTFWFYNHLFKSKILIYVFGYDNIIIRNTFENFQLSYYPKEIVKILLLISSSVCWGILWLSPHTLSFSHRCWKRSSLYLLPALGYCFSNLGETPGSAPLLKCYYQHYTWSFSALFIFSLHLLFNFLRKLIFDSSLFS